MEEIIKVVLQSEEEENNEIACIVMSQMYMSWGTGPMLLFEQWTPETTDQFIVSLIVIFFLSFLTSNLRSIKRKWIQLDEAAFCIRDTSQHDDPNPMSVRVKLTLFLLVQGFFGIALMLLCMTFNGWVIISIVAGLSLGYFLSGSLMDNGMGKVGCCL